MAYFFTSDLHFGDERLNLYGRDLIAKSSYEIDTLNPPATVIIPRHNILDNLGNDTGIECPSKIGHIFTHALLGAPNITHEVVILCESAKKPYSQQINNFAQCRTSTSTHVKCHKA